VIIGANRNVDRCAALGAHVIGDNDVDHGSVAGPLAGGRRAHSPQHPATPQPDDPDLRAERIDHQRGRPVKEASGSLPVNSRTRQGSASLQTLPVMRY
jgi:hypothetical protein